MTLIVLIIFEIVVWVCMAHNTPVSVSRLTVTRHLMGYAAFLAGVYAMLSFVFVQFTGLDAVATLEFAFANATIALALTVCECSIQHRHRH